MTARRARIEFMELDAPKVFPDNPKSHALGAIGEAYDDRGYVTPIVIDERTGYIAEGHGRLEELKAKRDAGEKAPLGIEVKNGKWHVPVVRGVKFASVDQLRRHILGANRIAEIGGWNNTALAKLLGKLGDGKLAGSGFGDKELVRFMKGADAGAALKPPGAVYSIIVECKNERQQVQLLRRFQNMSLTVKAIVT